MLAGDVLIVKARKDGVPSNSVLFAVTPPSFRSSASLEGRDVSSEVLGTIESPLQSQEGISYSFTAR
jgi:hypothetical protein